MFPNSTKILIVDDSTTERRRMRYLLKQLGFENVIEGSDGNDGFELLKQEAGNVGLILSDLNMPNCSGLELLKLVRQCNETKETPFIIFSSQDEKTTIIDAMSAGCSSYLVKPVQSEDLKERLAKVYERYNKAGSTTL